MKRSEMLYFIENLLANNKKQIKACLYADVADIMLSNIEQKGMLPPPSSYELVCLDPILGPIIQIGYKNPKQPWEDEDESN